ncbi:MAG TPA: helix-turn-helix domain-containing protein [Amycolatopsis sp.]|nr:helix-turn-helix domain-containing protein [Amycolatopsis sp.]
MARSSPQTERLISIAELLAADPRYGRSLADIARHLGVDKATCLPMLQELVRAGWLVRHAARKEYRLGPALVPLGRAAAAAVDVVDAARPRLAGLADDVGAAVGTVIPSVDELVLAEVVQPMSGRRGALGLRHGDRFPLRPPLGAVFVAWSATGGVQHWLDRRAAEVDDEVRAWYGSVLAVVRARGFAVEQDRPERPSVTSSGTATELRLSRRLHAESRSRMADRVLVGSLEPDEGYSAFSVNAPVFDRQGDVALALCAFLDPPVPRRGADLAAIGQRVRMAAADVTCAIGGIWPPASPN